MIAWAFLNYWGCARGAPKVYAYGRPYCKIAKSIPVTILDRPFDGDGTIIAKNALATTPMT